jgi:hypothetical protein
MYCILAELESWRLKYGNYPQELYIQLDGGSENANQYVLGLLELLAIKRVSSTIYFSRLPVGHTHEDIDACFALIWSCFRNQPCATLQMYKKIIEEKLGQSKLQAKVVDVMVIPDYKGLLEGHIDSSLSRLHKEGHTQHQWRFQAVIPTIHFPLGCKTTYKTYSSDKVNYSTLVYFNVSVINLFYKVIEFIKKSKDQCLSAIGRITGLEASTVFCPWLPSSEGVNMNSTRPGIEGFFIIKSIPHQNLSHIKPCKFVEGSALTIQKTLVEVRERFDVVDDSEIREAWDHWAEIFAPTTDDANQYIFQLQQKKMQYHCPLKLLLTNSKNYMKTDQVTCRYTIIIDCSLSSGTDFQIYYR